MAGRLENRVAVVTGGGGGVGHATAQLFVEEGARVAIVDVDEVAAREASSAIDPSGERVFAIHASLDQEVEAKRAIDSTAERFGRLDVLANVAGVRARGLLTDADVASWHHVLGGNLLAPAFCAKFAMPYMATNGGGSIINISSSNAVKGRSGMSQYDSSKAALLALSRDLAHEGAPHGIRVNCLCPGRVLTPYQVRRRAEAVGGSLEEAEAALRPEAREGKLGNVLQRHSTPREIAYGILFLACDESSYVTGTTLMVDGGVNA